MRPLDEPSAKFVRGAVARHLASAPVAFAVTEGPAHTVRYANALVRRLESDGKIAIAREGARPSTAVDLTPLLDRVFRSAGAVRDAVLTTPGSAPASFSCTIWPVMSGLLLPLKLVVELRDIALAEDDRDWHRDISERLLLSALKEQDVARDSTNASTRARLLATASRDLAMSLDEDATLDTIRRLVLPRPGTWCIVDVFEADGTIREPRVADADPAKEAVARVLHSLWPVMRTHGANPDGAHAEPGVGILDFHTALTLAADGTEDLRILQERGFGWALRVPLSVRTGSLGALTFVTATGDPPFTAEEAALAMDLAARAAMALDNARLFRSTDGLRMSAQQANQSKNEFLARMSHELRTPLNAIAGFAQLIDLGVYGPVTDEQHEGLRRIKASQEHLLATISDILDFAVIEGGRMRYHGEPVSLARALSDVAELLAGAISEKGLTVERDYEAGVVAWGDRDRVHQILVNLVGNAVKYTPRGGTITLSCRIEGSRALAQVADTGEGIPRESQESVFEPFVQLTEGLTGSKGGVGLGLAISRDLARAMSGDITVASTQDAGSLFLLSLPAAPR